MKTLSKTLIGLSILGIAATGCVAVPVGSPNGDVTWEAVPLPLAPLVYSRDPFPANVPARLYPTNDLARQIGMLNGSVTNLRNGRSVVVRVNDRGPFIGSRIADLSHAAAAEIGMVRRGVASARLEVLPAGSSRS